MLISDLITDANHMSRIGIIVSISKTTLRSPRDVFTGLATRAARRTSQLIGAHVEFTGDSLVVHDDIFPSALVLRRYRESLLRLAEIEAGLV